MGSARRCGRGGLKDWAATALDQHQAQCPSRIPGRGGTGQPHTLRELSALPTSSGSLGWRHRLKERATGGGCIDVIMHIHDRHSARMPVAQCEGRAWWVRDRLCR